MTFRRPLRPACRQPLSGGESPEFGPGAIDASSIEITAIPERLKKIDVRGGIVRSTRGRVQKAIAEEIIRGKADDLLPLRGNHKSLHRAVIEQIDERLEGAQELSPSFSRRMETLVEILVDLALGS